jgi:hypothetical protein
MWAYLTFSILSTILLVLARILGIGELLRPFADDHIILIVGIIANIIVASALTIWTLRAYRGWSPE